MRPNWARSSADQVVRADEHADEVGALRDGERQLHLDGVGHLAAADRDVGVGHRVRCRARERQQHREAIGPAPVLPRSHSRRVAEPLGERVADRDVPAPWRHGGHGCRARGRGGTAGLGCVVDGSRRRRVRPARCRRRGDATARRSRRRGRGRSGCDRAGARTEHVLVVPDELVAEHVPPAAAHRLTRTDPERAALGVVADEVAHPITELREVARRVEPSVDARAHEVERAAPSRGDDRHAARERLLDGLAERLALAGVHEHVEARHGLGERLATEEPGEHRPGQHPLEDRSRRSFADDDEPCARQVGERPKVLHLLLGRETADVADDDLARLGDATAPPFVASPGREPLGVDAATP